MKRHLLVVFGDRGRDGVRSLVSASSRRRTTRSTTRPPNRSRLLDWVGIDLSGYWKGTDTRPGGSIVGRVQALTPAGSGAQTQPDGDHRPGSLCISAHSQAIWQAAVRSAAGRRKVVFV